MTGTTPLAKRWPVRATRVFLVAAFLWNLLWGTHALTAGHPFAATICIVLLPAIVVTFARQVRYLHRADVIRNRPRPDYAAIARMEREHYGEAFEHAGAPRTTSLSAGAGGVSMAEAALGIQRLSRIMSGGPQATCPQGHGDQVWTEARGKVCPACDSARRAPACDCDDGHRPNLRWS